MRTVRNYTYGMPLPVTVVCGLDRRPTTTIARSLLGTDPDATLVTHCLDQVGLGLVSRTLERADGVVEPGLLELAHGCVSCTLREDVLPTLVRLARDGRTSSVVLLLPEAVEPIGFVEAFHGVPVDGQRTASDSCQLTGVVTVVTGSDLVPRLAQGLEIADSAISSTPEDDRTVAEILARQIEAADVVVALDAEATERGLLRLLNPTARLERAALPPPPGVFDLEASIDRCDPTVVPSGPVLRREADAWSLTWRASKPFHPERLHDCLDDVMHASLRARGQVWIASRPQAVVGWESTGPRINLGVAGTWRDHGRNDLWIAGVTDSPADLVFALDRAVLTPDEMAAGPRQWRTYDDPFHAVWSSHQDQDVEEAS
jgi:G3E family GTPase